MRIKWIGLFILAVFAFFVCQGNECSRRPPAPPPPIEQDYGAPSFEQEVEQASDTARRELKELREANQAEDKNAAEYHKKELEKAQEKLRKAQEQLDKFQEKTKQAEIERRAFKGSSGCN